MNLEEIGNLFNRAILHSFSFSKWLLVFVFLAFCGLIFVFCRGLAEQSGSWITMSLTFLPVFLTLGIVLSLGVLLTRIYHDELKNKEVDLKLTLKKSWDLLLAASYFSIPLVLVYLLLWIALGVFQLLKETPVFGQFLSVILSFAPFILNLAVVLLAVVSVISLFFLAPALGLKGWNGLTALNMSLTRIAKNPFLNILLLIVGALPLTVALIILCTASSMTGSAFIQGNSAYSILQWFLVMIPFTAVLAPTVIFFYNFALESHVYLKKDK